MEEYKKKTNSGDDVFIRIQPTPLDAAHSAMPTAVVLGWLASKPKNVAKYSALYESMGYNTVQTSAPFSVVFPVTPRVTAMFVLSVLRILASDDRLTSGGIVIHTFSNGGAVCAPHLSRFFHGLHHHIIKPDDKIVVKTIKDAMAAFIFDSGPVYLRIMLGARAINEGLGVPRGLFSALIIIAFTVLVVLQRLLIADISGNFWGGLRSAQYLCPEQYIYSRADHLLDVASLETLISERKQEGNDVRVWHVDDAEHVKIFRKYPKLYVETIRSVNDWGINAWRERVSLTPWVLPSREAISSASSKTSR